MGLDATREGEVLIPNFFSALVTDTLFICSWTTSGGVVRGICVSMLGKSSSLAL